MVIEGPMCPLNSVLNHTLIIYQKVVSFIIIWPTLLLNIIIYYGISSPTVGQGSANGWQTPDASSGHFKDIVANNYLGNAIPFAAQEPSENLPTRDTPRDRLRRLATVISEDESSDDDSK